MRPAVRLVGVSKSFRAEFGANVTHAARDVTLEVPRGQSFGLIGPNGAGKTTLLRLIAGIAEPDQGRIERLSRTVALIDLGSGFHPDLSGEENIDFACALLGMRAREVATRRESIREFAGLGDGIHKVVRHFSSGMVARLSFAIAVHADPALLLVDEVLAVGDVEFQRRCLAKLAELRSEGVTSMIVSHDLSAVVAVCDRVVLLDDGRVTSDGSPADVVATYLGTPLDHSTESLDVKLEVRGGGSSPTRIPVGVKLAARRRHPDAVARIQIGLPVHPAANVVEGLDGPLIIGEGRAEGPWSEMGESQLTYVVDATGLPPGRFVLRLVIDVPGDDPVFASSELVVPGTPPMSPEVVLDSSIHVRSADLGAV